MSLLRRITRSRPVRIVGIVLASLVGALLAFSVTFHLACNDDDAPDAPYDRPEVAAFAAEIPDYRRTEESTYLTLLEWYQVFSYQEYATWIGTEPPSGFPYFRAIGQSWSMYCHAYGATEGTYPFNAGNHLMLFVIGTSFSAEYALKGVYEMTSGWITEQDGFDTPEDRYAAFVAADYGEFIEREPWYAYPFGRHAVGVWSENPFFGEDMWRKTERKLFLSAEYGVKAGYALAIKLATGAIYGAPPATDHLWIANASAVALAIEGVRPERDLGNGSHVIALPHYQGFTDAVPQLVRAGVRFEDVSGNDEIVLTALAPRGWEGTLPGARELFRLDVPTDAGTTRIVLLADVPRLHEALLALDAQGVRIEHLFDY